MSAEPVRGSESKAQSSFSIPTRTVLRTRKLSLPQGCITNVSPPDSQTKELFSRWNIAPENRTKKPQAKAQRLRCPLGAAAMVAIPLRHTLPTAPGYGAPGHVFARPEPSHSG